jgi:hypothetical protein
MNFASLTPVLMTRLKKGRRYSPVGTIVKGWCAFVLGVLQINRKEAIPMSVPTSMELAMRYQVGFTAHEEATVELKELVEASDRSTNWAADHTLDAYCAHCTEGPGTNKKLKLCSRCGVSSYCSVEHQRLHWPIHKRVCGKSK